MWFFSLFGSKNKKLVQKWQNEHEQLVLLAHKVIGSYSKNDHENAKKVLKDLNSLVVDHIMNEDIEFYKLMKDKKGLDEKTEKLMHEFIETFKSTKISLMNFLTTYTKDDTVLDDTFFKTFNQIVEVLGKRITFEEENLYKDLGSK